MQIWIKGWGQFLLECPYDVIHDVIVCNSYVSLIRKIAVSFFR